MDFADCFTWFVLSMDATVLIVALGWYLAGDIRRKVPFRRSLTRDPRVFDPHVRVNGRWVPLDPSLDLRIPMQQPVWFGPRR